MIGNCIEITVFANFSANRHRGIAFGTTHGYTSSFSDIFIIPCKKASHFTNYVVSLPIVTFDGIGLVKKMYLLYNVDCGVMSIER